MSVLDILAVVGENGGHATAAEIVDRTGLPRSTVFRRLRELCEKSFLYQDASSKRYGLGPRILQLGEAAREQFSAGSLVIGPLLRLVNDTGETTTFSLVDIPWRICVCVFEAPSEVRQVAHVGARYPLHLGAAGKIILAYLPETLRESIFETHGVPHQEFDEIVRQLQEIRQEGIAVTTGERVAGACTVAAPVFIAGKIYGSVAAVGPSDRMQPMLQRHRVRVREVASSISRALSSEGPSIESPQKVGLERAAR